MNKLLLKICGITSSELAEQAINAGANFIGIIFHPNSKRFVSLETAIKIAAITIKHNAIPVAVFVDHTAEAIQEICQATKINTVQLHGETSRQQQHLLPKEITRIYTFAVHPDQTIKIPDNLNPTRDYLLFDHPQAGSGQTFDWQHLNPPENFKWFLAGGLNAGNVKEALRQLQPTGVDVSSGVENNLGEKDIVLVKEFIKNCNFTQSSLRGALFATKQSSQ